MIYQFVAEHQQEFPVERMCKVLEVSVSGYYAWRQHIPSSRQLVDEQLMERIRHDYEHSHGIYGSRRLQAALRVEGRSCGRKRVVRLMRHLGICARRQPIEVERPIASTTILWQRACWLKSSQQKHPTPSG
jgi:hypothetical protein